VFYYRSLISQNDCAPCKYSVLITAPSVRLTLDIRLYEKCAKPSNELLLNLDNVSLIGPN
jgi:hypothetical protein